MNNLRKRNLSRLSNIRIVSILALLAVSLVLQACDSGGSTMSTGTGTPTIVRSSGEAVYIRYCNVCHPGGGRGAGPSLKALNVSSDEIKEYVRHGSKGMPGFGPSSISEEELEELVQYVLSLRQ